MKCEAGSCFAEVIQVSSLGMRPAPDADDVAERCGVEVELETDVGLAVDAHVEPGPVDDNPVLDLHRRQFQLRQDLR